jgi:hypothetical protein
MGSSSQYIRDEEIEIEAVELPSVARHRQERGNKRFLLVGWSRLGALMRAERTTRSTRLLLVLLMQGKLDSVKKCDGWIEPQPGLLADAGLDRNHIGVVVAHLEKSGIIEVERRLGKRSRVRFLK